MNEATNTTVRKASRLRLGLMLTLAFCSGLTNFGCARMRNVRQQRTSPPLQIGAGARNASRAPGSAPLADRVRSQTPSQSLSVRSTALPPDAYSHAKPEEERPINVALLPPVARSSQSRPENEPNDSHRTQPASNPQQSSTSTPPKRDDVAKIRTLVDASRKNLSAIGNYEVQVTRQERVGNLLQPEENVVFSIRRVPRAVRLQWREGENKGREVIYAEGENSDQMHINQPSALVPRISLPIDSPLVLRSSRHPITEAGFDPLIDRLDESLRLHENRDPGADQMRYEGLQTSGEIGQPCHKIVRVTPQGETWIVLLDSKTLLPTLVQAKAADGSLLERYLFRAVRTNVPELAMADAFNPDARWGAPKGLFGRLARSGNNDDHAEADSPERQ